MTEENKELVDALLKIRLKRKEDQIRKLKKFDSLEDILSHLANSSTREREEFLKPWKGSLAKDGVGRKAKDNFIYWLEINAIRAVYESDRSKKFRSWKSFLQYYYKKNWGHLPIEEQDKKIRTKENLITKLKKKYGD